MSIVVEVSGREPWSAFLNRGIRIPEQSSCPSVRVLPRSLAHEEQRSGVSAPLIQETNRPHTSQTAYCSLRAPGPTSVGTTGRYAVLGSRSTSLQEDPRHTRVRAAQVHRPLRQPVSPDDDRRQRLLQESRIDRPTDARNRRRSRVFITYQSLSRDRAGDLRCLSLWTGVSSRVAVPGRCSPRHGDVRHWKVDRIEDAEVTQVHFNRPRDFDLQSHLAKSFGSVSRRRRLSRQ